MVSRVGKGRGEACRHDAVGGNERALDKVHRLALVQRVRAHVLGVNPHERAVPLRRQAQIAEYILPPPKNQQLNQLAAPLKTTVNPVGRPARSLRCALRSSTPSAAHARHLSIIASEKLLMERDRKQHRHGVVGRRSRSHQRLDALVQQVVHGEDAACVAEDGVRPVLGGDQRRHQACHAPVPSHPQHASAATTPTARLSSHSAHNSTPSVSCQESGADAEA